MADMADSKDLPEQDSGVVMTFRLQIPNQVVGAIIGKSGEIIKSIREQSQSRIMIADSQPNEDRDVTIKGTLASVDAAVSLIITNICQVRGASQSSFDMEQRDESLSLKVLVANDQAGAIIGKGGEVIKQLREESGARISIGKKIDFVRTVSIIGNANTVRAALAVLVRLVHDHPSSARDPFLHGYRSQPPGSNFRAQHPQQFGFGMSAGAGLSSYGMTQTGAGVIDNPMFGAPHPVNSGEPPSTLTLSVPHRTVGSIIGKRGLVINEIRHISGCRIDISPSSADTQFRTVTLTGTPHSIEIAHMMIQKYTYQQHPMQ